MKFYKCKPTFSTVEKHYLIPTVIFTVVASWYAGWDYAFGPTGVISATLIPIGITTFILIATD